MSNQAIFNYDKSKTFVWSNKFQEEVYTNSGYAAITLAAGTVMARLQGSTEIVPFDSSNALANLPLGVLSESFTPEAGESINVNICIAGDVVEDKLVFVNATDTVATTLASGQTVKDVLQANNTGIKLVQSTELTEYDNQ